MADAAPRLARFAWATVVVNLLVILWGAWVRASGSGAGCGSHWPLCNGAIVPLSPTLETITEFTHRLSSGLALLMVLGLVWWSRRVLDRGHRARRAAVVALVLIIIEALIGAGLVKFELVADNASMARALTLGAHLVNTQFLLAALALTAWWAGGAPPIRLGALGGRGWLLALGTVGLLCVGLTGAVASLGDTLFPARTLREGIAQDFDPTSHLLLRLRVLHPTFAVVTGMVIGWLAMVVPRWRRGDPAPRVLATETRAGVTAVLLEGAPGRPWGGAVLALVLLQWTIGLVSLVLLVPVALQLLHLLTADLLWMAWVLFGAGVLGAQRASRTMDATALATSGSRTDPAASSR